MYNVACAHSPVNFKGGFTQYLAKEAIDVTEIEKSIS
jgi:hypothetical protein